MFRSLDIAPPAPASGEVFRERRERLLARIGDGVALVGAAPELFRSRDTEVPYRPNADLYYLTGFEEPGSLALLTPHDPAHRFTLFVRPRDPEREAWNGPRVGPEEAKERYGADAVYPIEALGEHAAALTAPADRILHASGVDPAVDLLVDDLMGRARRARPRSGVGPAAVVDLETILGELRRVKDPDELDRMRTSARIAAAGHLAAIRAAAPGVGEWELEAVLEATFRAAGAAGPAFPSIVASGPNATTLHYTSNDRRTAAGELVLIDAGADWGMYCSDISRTFPVSGRFTAPQRALYDVVLEAQAAAVRAVRPGATIVSVHEAAVRILVQGMLDLRILSDSSPDEVIETGRYRRFYMHQTSHWLGLDVHDVGLYRESTGPVALVPGMVLTVEPGIYIPAATDDVPAPFRGAGVRIEDTVVVTESGHDVITRGVPVSADAIEALVGEG